jgi:hypothetical protein
VTQIRQVPNAAVSVVVQRSRLSGNHRAYVRVGAVEAGYRNLVTDEVHCTDEAYRETVSTATTYLSQPRRPPARPTSLAPGSAPASDPGARSGVFAASETVFSPEHLPTILSAGCPAGV